MKIESERLVYRLVEAGDLPWLFELHSDPEVMKFIRAPNTEIAQTKEWLDGVLAYQKNNQDLGIFVALRKTDRQPIGWGVLLHMERKIERDVEVGYRLFKREWGQGYATEIARALLRHGFKTVLLERIVGVTNPDHVASQKVLAKVGLVDDGFTTYAGSRVKLQSIHVEGFKI